MTLSSLHDACSHPPVARQARRRFGWAALLSAVALVVGCGGGGGDGTTTTAAATAALTQGTINGFGSVIVNGIRFVDIDADVVDDAGTKQTLGALGLGMSVTVESGAIDTDASGPRGHATKFHFGGQVLGPVDTVDVADAVANTGSFTLLGQVVDVTSATVFDAALSGGLTALKTARDAGAVVVEVHGLPDAATGHIVATRVESKAAATAYKLVGTVASLDTTLKTFSIGGAAISYATLASSAVPSTLADGATLRVLLATTTNADGLWVATSLGGKTTPADHTVAHLRGRITAFTSSTRFSVDGLVVDATNASFPDGTSALALGVVVEVEGTVSNSVLVATQVSLESRHRGDDKHSPQLIGAITAVDAASSTFVVRGVTVSYDATGTTTRFSPTGKTAADLIVGATVRVKGTVGSTRNQVKATEITFTTSTATSS